MSTKAAHSETIKQILPATGVFAVFADGMSYPVCCWALIERDDGDSSVQEVVGMIVADRSHRLDFCGPSAVEIESRDFVRYSYQDPD